MGGAWEKTVSRKQSSSSGRASIPAPFPLAVTVPEGQPRFRFTSSYPMAASSPAHQRKSSGFLVSSWGTARNPWLCSGRTLRSSRWVNTWSWVGERKGM